MTHRDAWALLDEFLDGALAADERWSVAAHLEDCAVCRKHVATQARLRGMVREHLMRIEPPSGLNDRLSSAIAAETRTPAIVAQRPLASLPIRLVALLGPGLAAIWLLASLIMLGANSGARLTRELAATHALFAQDESRLDVAGDATIVTRWFQDEVGLSVSAPELVGYEMVGGRLIALDGEPAAQLVYEAEPDGSYLSLLHFRPDATGPEQMTPRDGFAVAQQGPISLITWVAGQDHVALIGEAPASELRRMADDLAAARTSARE